MHRSATTAAAMKLETVRRYALSLPEVVEAPHFDYGSFRIRGKMVATVPPGGELLHVFVPEEIREPALAMYPGFLEKLTWGAKVIGVRVHLPEADAAVVKRLVRQAWEHKAPKRLVAAVGGAAR
jgi:hypothetical protein